MATLPATAIYNTMLKVQFKNNSLTQPDWLSDDVPYFNKAVVSAGRLLDETQRYWGWKPNIDALDMIDIDNKNLLDLWSLLLTTILVSFQGDIDKSTMFVESSKRQHFSLLGSLEQLIKNSIDKKTDLESLMHVTDICGISLSDLYASFCTQQALNRFRVEQGYMGIGAGNYVDNYPAVDWNDKEFAVNLSRELNKGDLDFHERVYAGLVEKYRLVLPEIKRYAAKAFN